MAPGDRVALADALGDYWNDLVAGVPEARGANLDPTFAAAIQRLGQLDDAGPPDPRFVGQLERVLLEAPEAPGQANSAVPARRDTVGSNGWRVAGDEPGFARDDNRPGAFAPSPEAWDWTTSDMATTMSPAGASPRVSPAALLSIAALVLLTLALGVLGGMPRQRAVERNWAPPVLPAIEETAAEFVWQSQGIPELLATRSSTDILPLSSPYHLAADPQGNIWIPDALSNQIRILAPDGTLIRVWGSKGRKEGEFNLAHGQTFGWYGSGAVAFDAVGNLYVADPGNFRIQKFAPDLRFLTAWGSKGESDGQFLGLKDLAIDAEGRVYALDTIRHDVQVFDADGEFLRRWGSRGVGEGEFLSPYGIAADAAGNVVVADTGNNRLQKFSSDGVFQAAWGGMGTEPAQFREPDDVAIDAQGRIFVTDSANNRVQVLDGDGRFLGQWGDQGKGPGQFRVPVGIAVDQAGNAYVTESVNRRVQKFRVTGDR